MADSDKLIGIFPETGQSGLLPRIEFTGKDNKKVSLQTEDNNDLHFVNASGDSLLRITTSGLIVASGGDSVKWNEAYSWGDHSASGYALDSTVVKTTGDQTISGAKTFQSSILLNAADPSTGGVANLTLDGSTGSTLFFDNGLLAGFDRTGSNLLFHNFAGGYLEIESNNNIAFRTNSTERINITNSGNVGIGVSNPNAKLEIYSATSGDTLLNIEGTNGNLFSVVDSTSGSLMSVNDITGLPAFEVFSDHSIVAGRFNANDFVISSGGDVGIGTAAPLAQLHVFNQTPSSSISEVARFGTSGTYDGNFRFLVGSTSDRGGELRYYEGNTEYSRVNFDVNRIDFITRGAYPINFLTNNNGTEGNNLRMSITSGGDVGIGTDSPSYKLHVNSNTNSTNGIIIDNINTGTSARSEIVLRNHYGAYTAGLSLGGGNFTANNFWEANRGTLYGAFRLNYASAIHRFWIGTGGVGLDPSGALHLVEMDANRVWFRKGITIGSNYNVTPPSEGLVVEGNVGIGTSAPSGLLHVVSTTNGNELLRLQSIATLGGGSRDLRVRGDASSIDFQVSNNLGSIGDWANLRLNKDGGYVGINTGNNYATTALDVSGVITATGGDSNNWNTAYGWGDHAGLYAAASHNHDDRYYTETESDSRFINASGDSMTGFLNLHADPTGVLQAATKQYVDSILATNNAMIFKGSIGSGGIGSLPTTFEAGWSYVVTTAGTYANQVCEQGDLIIATIDRASGGTDADWIVVQTNIDGSVVGPASATNGNFPVFNGTTGKLIANSSYGPSSFYLSTNPNGYTTNTGTVTSVGGTGTVAGLTLTGTVTTTGNLTLGGTLSVTPSNFASQTANTFLAAPNGSAGTPTFRAIVASDIPTLNQNTTGSANSLLRSGTPTTQFGTGLVGFPSQVALTVAGLFPATDNSNCMLTLNRHPGDYYSQLGFSSNGNLYYRAFSNVPIDTTTPWQTVWTSNSLTNLNQLTNGPGYTTNTGTVTSVAALTIGTTGSDVSSTVANGTTTPVITLNIPTASASNRGALSSTDWSTFNNKQAAITGGASTITSSNLTINRALISDASGKVAVSDITNTELSYLDNVSSNIQTQLNGKVTGSGATNYISKWNGTTTQGNSLIYDNATNIGIGTSSPSGLLHINHARDVNADVIFKIRTTNFDNGAVWTDADLTFFERDGGTTSDFMHFKKTGSSIFRIINNGNVGIGTINPTAKLHSEISDGNSVLLLQRSSSQGGLSVDFTGTFSSFRSLNGFKIFTGSSAANSGTERLHITSLGDVGIGTTSPSYKLQVNGSFGATTKSFRIDHPSKPNYTLEYGSLESPYHGVRLTGRGRVVKGSGTVLLPSYLKDLIHDDETINIQITNIKHGKIIYVDEIDLNNDQFTVRVDRAKTLGTLEFFWTFTGTRKDVDKLVVEKEK